jgi:hypothetical protein
MPSLEDSAESKALTRFWEGRLGKIGTLIIEFTVSSRRDRDPEGKGNFDVQWRDCRRQRVGGRHYGEDWLWRRDRGGPEHLLRVC